MRLGTVLGALATGLALATGAGAQEAAGENALRRGATSVQVALSPDVGLGVWTMLSGRTALGLVGSLTRVESSFGEFESSHTVLAVGPQLKRYLATQGAVLPYLHGSVYGNVQSVREDGDPPGSEVERSVVGASLAAGLDWFPVRRISLGGHAGVALNRVDSSLETGVGGAPREATEWQFETFTAALTVHLYL